MKIRNRIIVMALGIDILLVLAATIVLYILSMQPFYYWTETGVSFTAIGTSSAEDWLLAAIPATACILLILSVRFDWLSLISGVLFMTFGVMISLGPAVAMVVEGLCTGKVTKIALCPAADYIGWLVVSCAILCAVRFVLGIFQRVFHISIFPLRRNLAYLWGKEVSD